MRTMEEVHRQFAALESKERWYWGGVFFLQKTRAQVSLKIGTMTRTCCVANMGTDGGMRREYLVCCWAGGARTASLC